MLKVIKHCLLEVELWTPLWAVLSVLAQWFEGSTGSQHSHVLVCLYGTFSDVISIYSHFVLLCVYCIWWTNMYKIFSFSSLDVEVVVNISQSRKISTLFTVKIYRTYCSVKKKRRKQTLTCLWAYHLHIAYKCIQYSSICPWGCHCHGWSQKKNSVTWYM